MRAVCVRVHACVPLRPACARWPAAGLQPCHVLPPRRPCARGRAHHSSTAAAHGASVTAPGSMPPAVASDSVSPLGASMIAPAATLWRITSLAAGWQPTTRTRAPSACFSTCQAGAQAGVRQRRVLLKTQQTSPNSRQATAPPRRRGARTAAMPPMRPPPPTGMYTTSCCSCCCSLPLLPGALSPAPAPAAAAASAASSSSSCSRISSATVPWPAMTSQSL